MGVGGQGNASAALPPGNRSGAYPVEGWVIGNVTDYGTPLGHTWDWKYSCGLF